MPRIMQQLKQDIGPPKATPERLTRAKQSVRLAVDKPSLCHLGIARKRIPLSARHAFVCSLADEMGRFLDLVDSGPAELAGLTGMLLAMRRIRSRPRRARHKRDLSPVCRPRNGRKMSSIRNPLNRMRFTKRFSPLCVGIVVISVDPRFGRAKADFIWRGPCPPFEQRLAWTKRCFHRWSNLSGWPARFLSINRAGVCEIWESLPGRPTQCTERIDEKKPSLKRALNFASQMLSHPQGIKKGGPR